MYDAKTNTIMFPHIIAGAMLGGKKHTWNNVNGGAKLISDFNLIQNKFFGGNVQRLGMIKEYGFFLCPHYVDWNIIMGFYIHDPALVTELGKKLLQDKYPGVNIVYETATITANRVLTPEEFEKKKVLVEEAREHGLSAPEVDHATLEELDGLIRSVDSGKSNMAGKVQVDEGEFAVDKVPVYIQHKASRSAK
ncbi:MAG: hypothetical protein WCY09_09990 [Candidatus Omnitrophota bacterium]